MDDWGYPHGLETSTNLVIVFFLFMNYALSTHKHAYVYMICTR